jgi:hypothetical protein
MKRAICVSVVVLALGTVLYGASGGPGPGSATTVDVFNQISTSQNQDTSVTAAGGSSYAGGSSSQVNIDTTSITDVESRTPPLTTFPPYLPYWTHGGWGTIKAYFPNGPTMNDGVYETTFDPENADDMRELRSVLSALPHKGLLEAVGGILNGVAVALGGPDKYHHGRGLEIVNSITRDRRPEGKALVVFIDSNVNTQLLREEGYAYVGKVSVEGDPARGWDHAYKAAVTEALLWDTDILLLSGGMKGVTVGSNITFPSAAAGYSQANYSLSLFGAAAQGITEGKGKAVLSAEAYRYSPGRVDRREIPASLYNRIGQRHRPASQAPVRGVPAMPQPAPEGIAHDGQLLPRPAPSGRAPEGAAANVGSVEPAPARRAMPPQMAQDTPPAPQPATREPGIEVSRELFNMAGFRDVREVKYLTVR